MYASGDGRERVVSLLIDSGADISDKNNVMIDTFLLFNSQYGNSALDYAREYDWRECIQLLEQVIAFSLLLFLFFLIHSLFC